MAAQIDAEQVRAWIDDDIVEAVEQVPDEAAEFNFTIDMSNMIVHVVNREPDGPLVVGQQIEYGEQIQSRIQNLSEPERNELVARIRETLTTTPVVYGFLDARGANVRFEDVQRVLIERRIYQDDVSRQALMDALVDVWKAMQYLDDIVKLIDTVEK